MKQQEGQNRTRDSSDSVSDMRELTAPFSLNLRAAFNTDSKDVAT
jgi:hypothetical protein